MQNLPFRRAGCQPDWGFPGGSPDIETAKVAGHELALE